MSNPKTPVEQVITQTSSETVMAILRDVEGAVALLPFEDLEAHEIARQSIVAARRHALLEAGQIYVA